jgi:hypothetical protein
MHVLLVIDGNPDNNWYRVFKGLKGTALAPSLFIL